MKQFLGIFVALVLLGVASSASAQVCGDGAIDVTEECDDGNVDSGDGCGDDCATELGWGCVPSLFASGVNPAGVALAAGETDPHWTWSVEADGAGATPGVVGRNPAWADLPPGNWVTTDASFGASLTTQRYTYWFQTVFMPAAYVGTLTFDVAVAADNAAEVFINGTSYGSLVGFGGATTVTIPAAAFVASNNTVSILLDEYVPGTPRGILMYPGGGGILSQCSRECIDEGDCDDANSCTVDSCLTGACHHVDEPFGSACDTEGVCSEALPESTCVPCVDTEMGSTIDLNCTAEAPICDESGAEPTCVPCVDSEVGSSVDLNCTAETPLCDDSAAVPTCVACLIDDDCAGELVCVGGACETPEVPDAGSDADPSDAGSVDADGSDAGTVDADEVSVDADGSDAGTVDADEVSVDADGSDAGTVDADEVSVDADASDANADAGRDSGAPDSSAPDAAGQDAGSTPDDGGGNGGGCDCAMASHGGTGAAHLLLASLVAVAILRRRWNRGSSARSRSPARRREA